MEIVEEKALGAAHVEHALAAAQAVVVAEPLGDGHPAPVVTVAAVSLPAVPVEVLRPKRFATSRWAGTAAAREAMSRTVRG